MRVKIFHCTKKCWFQNKLWNPSDTPGNLGDLLEWPHEIGICHYCDGKGTYQKQECPKCKGTKRAEPPHHFELVEEITKED